MEMGASPSGRWTSRSRAAIARSSIRWRCGTGRTARSPTSGFSITKAKARTERCIMTGQAGMACPVFALLRCLLLCLLRDGEDEVGDVAFDFDLLFELAVLMEGLAVG